MVYNEHTGIRLSNDYGENTVVAQESIFLNFDIIELTFVDEGVYTVIPVVSSPIDIYNDITLPVFEESTGWLKTFLLILFAILLLILLYVTGLLPAFIKLLVWIVMLPFHIIAWIFKAIVGLFKKDDKDKVCNSDKLKDNSVKTDEGEKKNESS